MGLDPEVDAAGLVVLGEQEPLEAPLDVPLERVVAKPEVRGAMLGLVADAVDPHAAEEPRSPRTLISRSMLRPTSGAAGSKWPTTMLGSEKS